MTTNTQKKSATYNHTYNHLVFFINFIFSVVLCWGVSGGTPRLHDVLLVWVVINCLWLKPLIFYMFLPLMIAWIIFAPIGFQYGYPNAGMIASFLETNTRELGEVIDFTTVGYTLALLFFGVITFYFTKKIHASTKQTKFFVYFSGFLVVLFAANILPIKRESAKWGYSKVLNIFGYSHQQYQYYTTQREQMQLIQNKKDQWQIINSQPKYRNYVLVIGESASRPYLSAYGYPINTSPFLNTAKGIKYTNAIAPSGYTTISVPRMLTLPSQDDVQYENSIISLTNKVGWETYWISNQERLGVFDNEISYISNTAKHQYFYPERFPAKHRFDYEMLPQIQQALQQPSQKPKLIVVHLMGSHARFSKRVSNQYPKFHFDDDYLSDYLSSLYQTDVFLEQIYHTLTQQNQPFSMIYLSDHGLTATTLKHNVDRFSLKIPLFKLSSNDTTQQTDHAPIAGYGMAWYLTDWLGIDTANQSQNTFISTPYADTIEDIYIVSDKPRTYRELPQVSGEPLMPKRHEMDQKDAQ